MFLLGLPRRTRPIFFILEDLQALTSFGCITSPSLGLFSGRVLIVSTCSECGTSGETSEFQVGVGEWFHAWDLHGHAALVIPLVFLTPHPLTSLHIAIHNKTCLCSPSPPAPKEGAVSHHHPVTSIELPIPQLLPKNRAIDPSNCRQFSSLFLLLHRDVAPCPRT